MEILFNLDGKFVVGGVAKVRDQLAFIVWRFFFIFLMKLGLKELETMLGSEISSNFFITLILNKDRK